MSDLPNPTPTQPIDPLGIGGFGSLSLLLDAFIPGYSIISNILANILGLDVSQALPILGFLFALSKTWGYLYYQIRHQILHYLTCSILITSDLDAYYNVSRFLNDKKNLGKLCSDITATSNRKPDGSFVDPEMERLQHEDGGRLKGRLRRAQEYEARLGSFQYFWHNGRLFIWFRHQQNNRSTLDFQSARTVEAKLYCFSMSTTPIKELVDDAAVYQETRYAGLTKIFRPSSARQLNFGEIYWRSAAGRPSRPLGTVVMSKQKKNNLIADIKQYLLPATRKWYSQRGIPYRRGYLFYGAPGTGKTSLSFALAGLLDLNIYCVSLAERSIDEELLFELFSQLPASCLVLLEDIDTAGLQKRDDKIIKEESIGYGENPEFKKTAGDGDTRVALNGVTLSGLLNVIDGVASHEGRVLVMTTNDIRALDKALLRPGRIDVITHFPKSSKSDAHDLFVQTFMVYDGDSVDEKQEIPDSLKRLAEEFSEWIPDAKFTPAEIQGYLLAWKNSKPEVAVANVKRWTEGRPSAEGAAYSLTKGK